MKEQAWIEEGWFFHNHAWHLLHEIIKQIPKDTKSLLDIGAGTGIAAAIIRAVYPDIICYVTDIESESVPFWYKRNLVGFLNPELEKFNSNKYDVVISSHVLEHLENPIKLVQDMFRLCTKRLIIAVPDGDVHFYDHKIIFNRTLFNDVIDKALNGREYKKVTFPVYHLHMNNLVAVIDK